MFEHLRDHLDLYVFGVGSMTYSIGLISPDLEKLGEDHLVDRADRVEKALLEARHEQFDYERERTEGKLVRRKAAQRDVQIDRTVGQLYRNLKNYAEMEGDSKFKDAAQAIIDDLFPDGVRPIIHQVFEDQHSTIDELLLRLRRDHGAEVDLLGVAPLVDNLERLNAKFGEELVQDVNHKVSWSDVKAALDEAREEFAKLIFAICVHFLDAPEKRDEILSPVAEQNERIARHFSRRGKTPEIDPDTGDIVDEEDTQDDVDATDGDPVVDNEPEPVAE